MKYKHCTGNLESINPSIVVLDFPVFVSFFWERQEEDIYGQEAVKKTMVSSELRI